ncbi:MAG: membrane protein insertion efficiency factor YidD [archaeon]|nr:membrane protein insertion efficiency factor YidD [archaeon]
MKFQKSLGNEISQLVILFHQKIISPQLNKRGIKCRFYPTCSEYGSMAIKKYGFIKGWKMAINRINRCKPDNYGSTIDFP